MGTDYLAPADIDLGNLTTTSAKKGDFIGFTLNGVHSSELGIVRVSEGSRYQETLLPEFSNKTMNVPGADRTDYLGMEYTQKPIPLSIAFDSVTEEQIRKMKQIFSKKTPMPFVFDEYPYKTYYVKASNSPSLSYICFDESGNGGAKRVYKGEGKIVLVSFYPYAFCNPNYLFNSKDENKEEWAVISGLSEEKISGTTVYNPGDFDAPFNFKVKVSGNKLSGGSVKLGGIGELYWESKDVIADSFPEDSYVVFNGTSQLIEGYTAGNEKSGRIYNHCITLGNWFKLPVGLEKTNLAFAGVTPLEIEYKILYL
jgi:hypothetical protein